MLDEFFQIRTYDPEMAWIKPQYTKSQINKAGKTLTGEIWSLGIDESLKTINNWRSSHGYPLHIVTKRLKTRIRKLKTEAIVSQRLKRLTSIASKLKRFPKMELGRMHDLGGCRAIMNDLALVHKLKDTIIKANEGNPDLYRIYDYINNPKPDGYRGIHFVVKYQSKKESNRVYDGMTVEVQIRSQMQHIWATAVETVSAFTGQALKSNIGDDRWKRFFALMGSAVAILEGCPSVPDTPVDKQELIAEIKSLAEELAVIDALKGWNVVVKETAGMVDDKLFLLTLDTVKKVVRITGYTDKENRLATKQYIEAEQEHANNDHVQVVLVTVDSLASLRSAYPNYYLDTTEFTMLVERVINGDI